MKRRNFLTVLSSFCLLPFAGAQAKEQTEYQTRLYERNAAAMLWQMLDGLGVMVLSAQKMPEGGGKITGLSESGEPLQQLHVDALSEQFNISHIAALANAISERGKIISFMPLWLPHEQPGFLVSSRHESGPVTLREIVTHVPPTSTEDPYSDQTIARLDALFSVEKV